MVILYIIVLYLESNMNLKKKNVVNGVFVFMYFVK